MTVKKPELLAPAGNLDKLKIAFLYGADAVYVGTPVFGLRKYADNFSLHELKTGIDYANQRNKKLYLVLNGFAHDSDLEELTPFLNQVIPLHPHGFIISDIGVAHLVQSLCNIPIHVSTQASVTTAFGCQLWKNAGAKRIILAREVSLDDCKRIKQQLDIELETFIHGAMCASYSGKCTISNYSAGRDSNRGGCVQSCRHKYDIIDPNSPNSREILAETHIMNAKDLQTIELIPKLIEAGIDSLKIEGRMKSNLYVATACAMYRNAIDHYFEPNSTPRHDWKNELSKISNRTFSEGAFTNSEIPLGPNSIQYNFTHYHKKADFIGTIKAILPKEALFIQIKCPFLPGESLEVFQKNGHSLTISPQTITTIHNAPLEKTIPNSIVKLPWKPEYDQCETYQVIKRPITP